MRKYTLVTLLVILSMLLAACGGAGGGAPAAEAPAAEAPAAEAPAEEESAAEEPAAEQEAPAAPSQYAEAPMLAEMVAAGELPPVDERLPVDVMVLEPVEQIGVYGGTWHDATGNPLMNTIKMYLYDPSIRWKADYS